MSTPDFNAQWKECLQRLADEWRLNGSIETCVADGVLGRAQEAIAAGVNTQERVKIEGNNIEVSWWWLAMWMQNTDMITMGLGDRQGSQVLQSHASTDQRDVLDAWLCHPTMPSRKTMDFLRAIGSQWEEVRANPRCGKIVAEQVAQGRNHKHNIEVIRWMTEQQWNMVEAYEVLKKSKFSGADGLAQSIEIMRSQIEHDLLHQQVDNQQETTDKHRSIRKI